MSSWHDELERRTPAAGLLGYLNFSDGRPDPRWQRQLNEAHAFLEQRGEAAPWSALPEWFSERLTALHSGGTAAFRDVRQAQGVLILFPGVLAGYRQHHADLLLHQTDRDLFQPFFLARVFEAILAQGAPWDQERRILSGALNKLNDFVGHRPIAMLETRPRGEPYDHERVRPIPLFLRGAGVAAGRYHQLVKLALDILAETEPAIQQEAGFDPRLLDELALDPRAYDFGHPVNKRSNYVFGEWDPHHMDDHGRFRRYVVRQVTVDALLDRVRRPGDLDAQEVLVEAAAVLAGTVLMATGVSGASPTAHDSSATLTALMPRIARYRDAFYVHLLERLPAKHATRLRGEQERSRQPFGLARQHLNQFLAQRRATQLQQRSLALLFAEMGFPEASRREAATIPAVSVRILSEVFSRLTTVQLSADRGEFAQAVAQLSEIDDLLKRGIACGAIADPWNILGFQGLYPLSPAREDSVRDSRIDELVQVVESLLSVHGRLAVEAAATGDFALSETVTASMKRLATWWDQFASTEVGDVRRVFGGEALKSAQHVATALSRWHERGEGAGDLAFWRQHLEDFQSPKAFARVVDLLLQKNDYRAAMALLINWLGQVGQVPLEDGEHSFYSLALRWMLGRSGGGGPNADLVRKFFDYLEANAEEYWQVPTLGDDPTALPAEDKADSLYEAAYEGVTYRDSADDDQEGAVIGADEPGAAFDLEAESESLIRRLRFLSTLARLWQIAARRGPMDRGVLNSWLARARDNHRNLLSLLDALQDHAIPEPLGGYDSLVEFDRRRTLKEQLLQAAIGTCLDNFLALGSLRGAIGEEVAELVDGDRPPWEPLVIQLERAFFQGGTEMVRALLPQFLNKFASEPLLALPLSDGIEPRQVLRVRIAQIILRALGVNLPRLGLLRETCQLLKLAYRMEQAQRPPGRSVTEFNHLFEASFQSVVESVVHSAGSWPEEARPDQSLVELLESVTAPFLELWTEHSKALQVSVLERAPEGEGWERLTRFIRKYGGELFHARFMTLANLRGILHRGVGSWLEHLRDNPDPLRPISLFDDVGQIISEEEATANLQLILQALVENYEEFKDYNTTTAQSDYGENLFILLDFLLLKADYERSAWQLRPLAVVHNVLARKGRGEAALLWQEAFAEATQELAKNHADELAQLEREHGVRLVTISDRIREEFVKPLAVDRLCALIEPAMEEARRRAEPSAFRRLQDELQTITASPTGVGLDAPDWLRQLEVEIRRVRGAQSTIALLATEFFQVPHKLLSYDDVQRQLEDWEKPLA